MSNYYVVRTRCDVDEYVNKGVSAVGWSDVDFTSYNSADEVVKAVQEKCYSNSSLSKQLIGRKKGEVKRFKSICKGDIVLVPCDRGFYIGIATGNFRYDQKSYEKDLSNQVVLGYVKRGNTPAFFARDGKLTALSTKLGVRGFTVLSITEDEIINEIERLLDSGEDISYQDKVAELEVKKANEFRTMLKSSISNYCKTSLKSGGRGFEELIAAMMTKDGYDTRILSKRVGGSSESDADVFAIKRSALGDEFTNAYYIQAKHYSGTSDNGIDQIVKFKNDKELEEIEYGSIDIDGVTLVSDQIKYVLISSGEFTKYVENKANENSITLIDGGRLAEIIFDIIDDLPDIRYQLGFVKRYEHI